MPERHGGTEHALAVAMAVAIPLGAVAAQAPTRPTATAVPEFAFAIDPAAAAAGLGPLRAAPLPSGAREVRVWTGFGLGTPHSLYRIHTSRGAVRGALVLWWDHDGERSPEDNPESMHAYVARVFGCGPIRHRDGVDACRADRIAPQPDWRAVLAQLDSIGLNALETPPADPDIVTVDGFHMVVEVRDGAAYRTASFDMGARAATGPAAAILVVLQRVRAAAVRDSTPGDG